ncbi:hydrogenase maturation protease [Dactylosporangium sucinum]|uniref:Peptidase M52 n=1 Tax=Dactylosporangium sucinum TaxID=1424081 RepID=A0A917U9D4_9ACTN|nr:hydrogenase maturation protease [Dactylosporangium sucinum]GGM68155.1 peptidase M52 [Dactylosporangium sucinum]
MRPEAVVIGVGNPYRRDDGVGLAVVDRLRAAGLPGVTLAESDGEAVALILLWQCRRVAVVVDAVRADPPHPGRIHRMAMPEPGRVNRPGGTHATGPADAVALARTLGRLPQRLVLYGVEAADTGYGCGLSPGVAGAADRLAARIADELRAATGGRDQRP